MPFSKGVPVCDKDEDNNNGNNNGNNVVVGATLASHHFFLFQSEKNNWKNPVPMCGASKLYWASVLTSNLAINTEI